MFLSKYLYLWYVKSKWYFLKNLTFQKKPMKFLFIAIVLIFVFGKIFKYALKYWMLNSFQKSQNQSFNPNYNSTKKEGSIHVDDSANKNTKSKGNNGGEYIDYEIIK